jgi:glutamine amidotransferase
MIITIIDYNMGNFAAIKNMLKKLGYEAVVTSDPKKLQEAEKIILPGVGSFDYGMKNLNRLGLSEILKHKVLNDNIPILGVCLGMQLLTKSSEEGDSLGLGFIDAKTVKFNFEKNSQKLKVPSMGWNYINKKGDHSILHTQYEKQKFYFVHSYYVICSDANDILAESTYGIDFVSAFKHKNIYGCQFHPEKSHKYGLEVLKNFAELEV